MQGSAGRCVWGSGRLYSRYTLGAMPAIISMLRGVNVGGHNVVKMEALRGLYESVNLKSPKTFVQSGNVVFLSKETNLQSLSRRIQEAIESNFGFRPDVILRSSRDMRHVIARNPFAGRHGIEPGKLQVMFLASEPAEQARESLLKLDTKGEELHFRASEVYIYFRNGMGKTKLSMLAVERALSSSFTGRNWNTVTKLMELAESLEKSA